MVVDVAYISKERSDDAGNAPGSVTGILAVQGAFAEHAAMLDRLLHRSVVVTLDGASYRLRHHATAAEEIRRATTGTNLR